MRDRSSVDDRARRRLGPRRAFDIDWALEIGERLFRERGYDLVGVAALTEAMDIVAPSFYAAFGSKAEFFKQVLLRYDAKAPQLSDLLKGGTSVLEALDAMLSSAIHGYVACPSGRGCLVLESARSGSGAVFAETMVNKHWSRVRAFIAAEHAALSDRAADAVMTTMFGLSACARAGWPLQRLMDAKEVALAGLGCLLGETDDGRPIHGTCIGAQS